jgi:hypothetical protein
VVVAATRPLNISKRLSSAYDGKTKKCNADIVRERLLPRPSRVTTFSPAHGRAADGSPREFRRGAPEPREDMRPGRSGPCC